MTWRRQMRVACRSLGMVAVALLLAPPASANGADDVLIELAPGESQTLSFDADIGTAFVADPGMADVEVLDSRRVFVLGRGHGVTSLKVFGLEGALLGAYAVRVQVQSAYARTIAARLAGKADRIDVESIGDALFVSGTATDPSEAERVLRGIRAVSGETPVVDALALETSAQVNLEVLISEVSRNVTQQLGIDWSLDLNPFANPLRTWVTGTGVRLATGSLGVDDTLEQVVEFYPVTPDGTVAEEPQFTNPVQELAVVQPFAARGGDGSVVLSHTKEVNSAKYRASAFLEALAENGLAVVHARPNLTAVSGQPAEFFSGLEIPVPTITDRGTIGTEYRQTGVSLTFTPTVLDRDHISLVVQPRIREIAAGGATPGASPLRRRSSIGTTSRSSYNRGFGRSPPAARRSPGRSCRTSTSDPRRPRSNSVTASPSPSRGSTGAARPVRKPGSRCSKTSRSGAHCSARGARRTIPSNSSSS